MAVGRWGAGAADPGKGRWGGDAGTARAGAGAPPLRLIPVQQWPEEPRSCFTYAEEK